MTVCARVLDGCFQQALEVCRVWRVAIEANTATEVLSFTIYRRFFTEDRMGYGSAISVVTLFVLTLIIVLGLYGSRRFRKEA